MPDTVANVFQTTDNSSAAFEALVDSAVARLQAPADAAVRFRTSVHPAATSFGASADTAAADSSTPAIIGLDPTPQRLRRTEIRLSPTEKPPFPAPSTTFAVALLILLLAIAICSKSVSKALKSYKNSLLYDRERNNAFDGSGRIPGFVNFLLSALFVLLIGTALYLAPAYPTAPSMLRYLGVIAIVAAYYIAQIIVYNLVGYSFTTPDSRRRWLRSFEASQALCGVFVAVPTLLLVCIPQWHNALIITIFGIYIIARLAFVVNGYRIYRPQMQSLLYFILYLCCVEIIPPILIWNLILSI